MQHLSITLISILCLLLSITAKGDDNNKTKLTIPFSGKAQTVITYGYDAAGNRASRTSSIEIAAVNESQISEGKRNTALCDVSEPDQQTMPIKLFFETNYWWENSQLVLCSLDSSGTFVRMDGTKLDLTSTAQKSLSAILN